MNTILLLHGAIGAADQLEPLAVVLRQKGFAVHTLNFSGHGQTPFSASGFGIEIFAEELRRFISDHQLQKPHIFGYSMGGYVALYLAAKHPDLIGNIITLGTKFGWDPETAAREVKMLDPAAIEAKVPKFAMALQQRHGGQWKELLSRTAKMMLKLGENNLLDAATLAKVSDKTLIGLADNDTMVSVEETDHAASCIPGAKRFTLENTKHPIETADPLKLGAIIEEAVTGSL